MLNGIKVTKDLLSEIKQAADQASYVCKMTGEKVILPCAAAGCPLFGDCLTAYGKAGKAEKESIAPDIPSNKEWLRAMSRDDLTDTIHAFHLGYAPWCDYHCRNKGDDGCDVCIRAWLDEPATEAKKTEAL